MDKIHEASISGPENTIQAIPQVLPALVLTNSMPHVSISDLLIPRSTMKQEGQKCPHLKAADVMTTMVFFLTIVLTSRYYYIGGFCEILTIDHNSVYTRYQKVLLPSSDLLKHGNYYVSAFFGTGLGLRCQYWPVFSNPNLRNCRPQ